MLRTATVLVPLAASFLAAIGCGIEPGSGQCRETSVELQPVTVTDPLAHLTLTATLTADGDPVAGAELSFFTLTAGADGATGGRHIGSAETGPDGVARFERPEGIDGLVLPEEELTGFQADFTPLQKIDDVQYCKARVDAPATI